MAPGNARTKCVHWLVLLLTVCTGEWAGDSVRVAPEVVRKGSPYHSCPQQINVLHSKPSQQAEVQEGPERGSTW